MELNAKIASLEDEVKLLKGEVKLILSEIRTAILGQDNPFAEPGQALRADPGALESRPPIRVVRVPSEDEEGEAPEQPPPAKASESLWDDETEDHLPEAAPAEEPDEVPAEPEPAPAPQVSAPPPPPVAQPPPPVAQAEPEPPPPLAEPVVTPLQTIAPIKAAAPRPGAPDIGAPHWNLITIAGLAVWAEEATKQIGTDRLCVLLDLCEFTGYLSASAKEAILKVMSLGQPEEHETPPSANEYLVVLCQLDALMHGEEPAGQNLHSLINKWQQPA